MKNSVGEEYTGAVQTTWGIKIATTDSETLFFKTLNNLYQDGKITIDMLVVSESTMLLKGFVNVDCMKGNDGNQRKNRAK